MPLGEFCTVFSGYGFKSELFNNTGEGTPVVRIRDVNSGFSNTYYSGDFEERFVVSDGDILIGMDGDFGATRWKHGRALLNQRVCRLERFSDRVVPDYVFYQLRTVLDTIHSTIQGSTVKHLSSVDLAAFRLPVPPIELQHEIVRILDHFTELEAELEAELAARRIQQGYFREALLLSDHLVPGYWGTLADVGRVSMCKRIFKSETSDRGEVPFFKIGTFGATPDSFISRELYENYRERYPFPRAGEVLISAAGTIGRSVEFDGRDAYFQDSNIVWIANDESAVLNRYLYHWYTVATWTTDGGTIQRLYNENLRRTPIRVPSLRDQTSIVDTLDKFDTLVSNTSIGLPAELAARRKQYEYYRDKLLTFEEAPA